MEIHHGLLSKCFPMFLSFLSQIIVAQFLGKHDAALANIVKTLHELIMPPDKEKRSIGFKK